MGEGADFFLGDFFFFWADGPPIGVVFGILNFFGFVFFNPPLGRFFWSFWGDFWVAKKTPIFFLLSFFRWFSRGFFVFCFLIIFISFD